MNDAVRDRGLTMVDVIRALAARGFAAEAANLAAMARLRVAGDYLQTAAIDQMRQGGKRGQRPQSNMPAPAPVTA